MDRPGNEQDGLKRPVTPHHLIVAMSFMSLLVGGAALRELFPENYWVDMFLQGPRFIVVLLLGFGVIYAVERAYLRRNVQGAEESEAREP